MTTKLGNRYILPHGYEYPRKRRDRGQAAESESKACGSESLPSAAATQEQLDKLAAVCDELERCLQVVSLAAPVPGLRRFLQGETKNVNRRFAPVSTAVRETLKGGQDSALQHPARERVLALDTVVEAQQGIIETVDRVGTRSELPELINQAERLQEESDTLRAEATAVRCSGSPGFQQVANLLDSQADRAAREAEAIFERVVAADRSAQRRIEATVEEALAAHVCLEAASGVAHPRAFPVVGVQRVNDIVDSLFGVASEAIQAGDGKLVMCILQDLDLLVKFEEGSMTTVTRGNVTNRAVRWIQAAVGGASGGTSGALARVVLQVLEDTAKEEGDDEADEAAWSIAYIEEDMPAQQEPAVDSEL